MFGVVGFVWSAGFDDVVSGCGVVYFCDLVWFTAVCSCLVASVLICWFAGCLLLVIEFVVDCVLVFAMLVLFIVCCFIIWFCIWCLFG